MKAVTLKIMLSCIGASFFMQAGAQSVGFFEGHKDIGTVQHPGSASYNEKSGEYQLAGSGTNIWGTNDEFHFAWRKFRGNFILQARVKLLDKGVDPHRKLGWMIRKSLEATSPCVNATVHGDGLTSLQFRKANADSMKEKNLTPKHRMSFNWKGEGLNTLCR